MGYFPPQFCETAVVRAGDFGYAVWTCQLVLNAAGASIATDGAFGPRTEQAVVALQRELGIRADGVLGPETMWRLCKRECVAAEAGRVPRGVAQGVCYGESNGLWPTTTAKYPDGTRDLGPMQDNEDPTDATLVRASFDVKHEAQKTVAIIKAAHDRLATLALHSQEELWRLAILTYNWPLAAEHIAKGERRTWHYTVKKADGTVTGPYYLDDPQWWVEQYKIPNGSGGILRTGWEWCQHYVSSKMRGPNGEQLVTAWTV